MAAFHLLCEGKADYKPREGFEEKLHVIGEASAPILICKKGEVKDLFNDTFYAAYQWWERKHFGFPIPDLDPLVENAIVYMESHYERSFSQIAVIIKYLEALLKRGV